MIENKETPETPAEEVVAPVVAPVVTKKAVAKKAPVAPSVKLQHPLPAKYRQDNDVSASFQKHKDRKPASVNPGTDYACKTGTAVYAAHNGVVTVADKIDDSAAGRWVAIRSGNTETQYLHLSKVAVKKGQRVAAGSLIGLSGSTGASTGPHLHFVIKVNGKNVDPEKYV
jgi:murein DD-endopeptidase MepM/ murein hydrolase activator NlpD